MVKKDKKQIEVSVIVPCYNEENTIQLLLSAILSQNFEKEKIEVIIADANSEDQTRIKIVEFAEKHKELSICTVVNPGRTIPAAVNAAANRASGEILVRMDAHSVPDKDYIFHSVNLLKSGKAQNVGGVWEIQPGSKTCIAKAIARAASHPLGAGDANYRISRKSGYVDTVPFGAFRKDVFMKLGQFNEKMLSNEDYEFNTRLRKNGGKVWMDTRIRSKYFARKNLKEIARQYWRYGFWKVKMLKNHPDSLRWRQAIPPLFLLFIFIFGILSFLNPIALIIFLVGTSAYLLALIIASLIESVRRREISYLLMPFAFIAMHFNWGGGFLYSLFKK